jgi:hypothetical protein
MEGDRRAEATQWKASPSSLAWAVLSRREDSVLETIHLLFRGVTQKGLPLF